MFFSSNLFIYWCFAVFNNITPELMILFFAFLFHTFQWDKFLLIGWISTFNIKQDNLNLFEIDL